MQGSVLLASKKTKEKITDYLPDEETIEEISHFFSVYADKTRVRILSALVLSEMCVTDIAAVLSVNQTTISHQLRFMHGAGAVGCRREGKTIFYYLKDERVGELLLKGMEFLTR